MGSITDNGAGNYTLAFDTAFNDTNYSLAGFARHSGATSSCILTAQSADTKTASSMQVRTEEPSIGAIDAPEVGTWFWGDYA